jgi:enamine deaminase RidA (YjgF/YER057c/UK114 family)
VGAAGRLFARGARGRAHPGQRHHRHAWQRAAGGGGDAGAQAVYILDKIAASLAALGGSLDDVVRTRVYLTDVADWER